MALLNGLKAVHRDQIVEQSRRDYEALGKSEFDAGTDQATTDSRDIAESNSGQSPPGGGFFFFATLVFPPERGSHGSSQRKFR